MESRQLSVTLRSLPAVALSTLASAHSLFSSVSACDLLSSPPELSSASGFAATVPFRCKALPPPLHPMPPLTLWFCDASGNYKAQGPVVPTVVLAVSSVHKTWWARRPPTV